MSATILMMDAALVFFDIPRYFSFEPVMPGEVEVAQLYRVHTEHAIFSPPWRYRVKFARSTPRDSRERGGGKEGRRERRGRGERGTVSGCTCVEVKVDGNEGG